MGRTCTRNTEWSIDRDLLNKLMKADTKYACGRMSYSVGLICGVVQRNVPNLYPETKRWISDYISGRNNENHIGMDIDRYDWMHVKDLLDESEGPYDEAMADFGNNQDFWFSVASGLRSDAWADVPELSIDEYISIISDNTDILDKGWITNMLRDAAEAFGGGECYHPDPNYGPFLSIGAKRDPDGYHKLYNYLWNLYTDIVGHAPDDNPFEMRKFVLPEGV